MCRFDVRHLKAKICWTDLGGEPDFITRDYCGFEGLQLGLGLGLGLELGLGLSL